MKTKPEKVPRLSSLIDMFCLCRCVGKKASNATTITNSLIKQQPKSLGLKMAEGGVQFYACDICGQEGLTEDDMRSHVLIEHVEGAISCPFCDLEGTTVEEMNMHVNAEHLDFLTPTKESVAHSVSMTSDLQNCNGFSDSNCSDGAGNVKSSDSASMSGLSSSDTTPEGYNDLPITPPPVPMEITITTADSPKRSPSHINGVSSKAGSPPGEEGQIRKRAKLYLDVPPVRPQSQLCKTDKNDNCSKMEDDVNKDSSHKDMVVTVHKDHKHSGCQSVISEVTVLPPRETVTPTKDKPSPLHCPLCDWATKSPGDIVRHVNAEHLDILSPLTAKASAANQPPRTDAENNVIPNTDQASTSATAYECPICGHCSKSGSSLELHVNSKHADILSPGMAHSSSGVVQLQSPMSLGSSSDSSMCCPVCGMEFGDTHDLAVHVDGHFSAEHTPVTEQMDNLLAQELERRERAAFKMQEQKEFEKLQELYGMNGKGNYRKQAERNLERAVCHGQMSISDYYTRKMEIQQSSIAGVDDGHSCTGGILECLKHYYKTTPSNVANAWVSSPCDHYATSYGDKGWGCGYRNLQMLLSCLSHNASYEKIIFNVNANEGMPMIPSIPKIQRLIEAAWQKGFDLQGCEQLGGRVVDTTKWIGATEIVATLSSLKIKCQLVDFHAPTGKDGTHPRLFEWVRDYFKRDVDFKPPLYLQHQGHSRTIVGAEEFKDGQLRLLLYDPSCSRKQMLQFINGDISANLMRCVRRSLHSMKAKQYQIVAVVGILNDREFEESKMMKSDRIP